MFSLDRRIFRSFGVASVMLLMATPVFAWGKAAQRIIGWTSIRALPPAQAQKLMPFETALLDGAAAADETVTHYFERDSVAETMRTVAHEMSLLRSASADGMDSYLAYRFGILAQVVADLNQPFIGTESGSEYNAEQMAEFRSQYERDAERALDDMNYGYKSRRAVYDVDSYFAAARQYVQHSEYFLAQDYKRGAGFSEYGYRSLNLYFDSAVNSVADVWFTILGTASISPFIPPRSVAVKRFRIEGVRYFLQTGHDNRAAQVVADIESDGPLSPDAERRIADAYFDTGRRARAITSYERVLKEQPNWADVRARLRNYYYSLGQAYMKGGLLDEARSALQRVLTHDPQFLPARQELDNTISLVADREQRRNRVRARLKDARDLEEQAAGEASSREYASAINYLREADSIYASVTTEFRTEYSMAYRARVAIQDKMARFSSTIIKEAMALDGIAEQRLLSKSMQHAARKHAVEFVGEVAKKSHQDRTRDMQRRFVDKQKESL